MGTEQIASQSALDVAEVALGQGVVAPRERFFGQVSLANTIAFCSDDRTKGLFIKIFGGVQNIVYNLTIQREIAEPGSVTGTYEAETAAMVPVIIEHGGLIGGVHSDTAAENGHEHIEMDRTEGKAGCGYVEFRQVISEYIADNEEETIADAKALQPELFTSEQDDIYAAEIVAAHRRLANRPDFFNPSRLTILQAIRQGAKAMVVGGPHVAKEGIINLVEDSTLESDAAAKANLPAYNHDAWATQLTYEKLRILFPYDEKRLRIAELVDAIGTMRVLGVEKIEMRREAAQVPLAS